MAKKTITIGTFIKNNRKVITEKIFEIHKDLVGKVKSMNDKERQVMILNEPELASWAAGQGVCIASKL